MNNFYLNRDPRFGSDRLTADHAGVTNSAVLVDSGLEIPIGANENIAFELFVKTDAEATADIDIAWDIPAGCGGNWHRGSDTITVRLLTDEDLNNGAAFDQWIIKHGIAENGATAGTLKLQYAQNVAQVGITTKLLEGSFVRWWKL